MFNWILYKSDLRISSMQIKWRKNQLRLLKRKRIKEYRGESDMTLFLKLSLSKKMSKNDIFYILLLNLV